MMMTHREGCPHRYLPVSPRALPCVLSITRHASDARAGSLLLPSQHYSCDPACWYRYSMLS